MESSHETPVIREAPVTHANPGPRRGRAGEAGQVVPMVAAAIGIMAISVLIIALVGQRAVARAQARTAADAAALAAAVAGADVGSAIATANGAGTVDVSVDDHVAFATVTIDTGRAGEMSAQARAEEIILPGADELAPAMIAAIARAQDLLGIDIPIVSGFRTNEEQQALWDNRHNNPLPVAVPGTSRHELGLAIDVPSSFVPTLLSVAAEAGLCHPLPITDPPHFILCG